ncbi:hypothetical protein ACSQ9X_22795, partial [Salmonella enterica]
NMSEPLAQLNLFNQLQVSRRTLQKAFQTVLVICTNAWLKRIRLNAERPEFISPWSLSDTVKDPAMQWGYCHQRQYATA